MNIYGTEFNKVVVVGVGGTGSYLLPQLIRYLNSRKEDIEVTICDGDKYDEGNMNRQEFAHSMLNRNKAEVQTEIYMRKFKDMTIFCVPDYLGEANIKEVNP